jgi:hypothetical protein
MSLERALTARTNTGFNSNTVYREAQNTRVRGRRALSHNEGMQSLAASPPARIVDPCGREILACLSRQNAARIVTSSPGVRPTDAPAPERGFCSPGQSNYKGRECAMLNGIVAWLSCSCGRWCGRIGNGTRQRGPRWKSCSAILACTPFSGIGFRMRCGGPGCTCLPGSPRTSPAGRLASRSIRQPNLVGAWSSTTAWAW